MLYERGDFCMNLELWQHNEISLVVSHREIKNDETLHVKASFPSGATFGCQFSICESIYLISIRSHSDANDRSCPNPQYQTGTCPYGNFWNFPSFLSLTCRTITPEISWVTSQFAHLNIICVRVQHPEYGVVREVPIAIVKTVSPLGFLFVNILHWINKSDLPDLLFCFPTTCKDDDSALPHKKERVPLRKSARCLIEIMKIWLRVAEDL